jgi:O-antigen polymerase
MLSGLIEAIWGLLQLYGVTRSFHSGFKITGTFFNPAPYALYLAAIFPLALGNMLRINDGRTTILMSKVNDQPPLMPASEPLPVKMQVLRLVYDLAYNISILTVISIILVLPATMNRASWLGASAGSLLVFNYRYSLFKKAKLFLHNTSRKLGALAIAILVVGISGTGLYLLKKGSSVGRLLIWEVTMDKIAERPLFGYGIGRFEAEYNNWQAGYFKAHPEEMDGPKGLAAGNTKYCFNEYLEMASEIGVTGMLLFLGVIVSVFLGIYIAQGSELRAQGSWNEVQSSGRRAQVEEQSDEPSADLSGRARRSQIPTEASGAKGRINEQSLFISSLISLLVCALVSFPFYSLPTLILYFLFLAIISSQVKGDYKLEYIKSFNKNRILSGISPPSTPSTFSTLSTLSTGIILAAMSVYLVFTTEKQYKAYYTWDEAAKLYQTGSYAEACQSFSEIYAPLQYTGSYLQYYGKALYLNEKYAESKTMLERAAKYNTDEILCCSMGDSYKALKMYSEAEKAYRQASFMVPHKLYPLYLLATLFDETGQRVKALEFANLILQKEIKVESEATNEIKLKMKKIIENNE